MPCLASEDHDNGIVDSFYPFLPDDWMNNTYWQDETHCVNSTFTDTYITFDIN